MSVFDVCERWLSIVNTYPPWGDQIKAIYGLSGREDEFERIPAFSLFGRIAFQNAVRYFFTNVEFWGEDLALTVRLQTPCSQGAVGNDARGYQNRCTGGFCLTDDLRFAGGTHGDCHDAWTGSVD